VGTDDVLTRLDQARRVEALRRRNETLARSVTAWGGLLLVVAAVVTAIFGQSAGSGFGAAGLVLVVVGGVLWARFSSRLEATVREVAGLEGELNRGLPHAHVYDRYDAARNAWLCSCGQGANA
jgi:drug/metabolite transporter (DMT)-like permease